MSKNAFEIRTEILSLAKDYMDKQHALNVEVAQKMFEESVKIGQINAGILKDYIPKMYTVEELMENAKKFYSFVECKDSK